VGFYLERDDGLPQGKGQWLVKHANAEAIAEPTTFPYRKDYTLVVVVNNGPFEAAGIAYDEEEFLDFVYPDGRPKAWYWVPNEEIIRQKPHLADEVNGVRSWRSPW
jgi:hypothetical protein